MITKQIAIFTSLAFAFFPAPIQADGIPLEDPRWMIEAEDHAFEMFAGIRSLKLLNGDITLADAGFMDGTIEFDIAVPYERGFSGIQFRVGDGEHGENKEEFYIRHHLSGMPDANQYTPVFNGVSGWQLYHGPQYSTPVTFPKDDWQHVKLVINGDQADIYLNGSESVSLAIDGLKRDPIHGALRLYSRFAPVHFANFEMSDAKTLHPDRSPAPPADTPASRVASWQVSSAFPEAVLAGLTELPTELEGTLSWTTLKSEEKGITNMARVNGTKDARNTAFAALTLTVDDALTRPFTFGYSDKVRLYLNGELLFSGQNSYRSRDYRYLGTIGLFETVPLRLKPGRNDLRLAVTEAFGGWGVIGDFPETTGLTIGPGAD